ncbi:SRPBCC family protein [Nocardia sp. 2]|uniref:SRPBCC family protein n=1 Tax=Nocardia acididurans TaxID=2802282 RepID=A0ABS1M440_9NOCA|nr:SRPBCC family protein [Nocardia acididurans]MBL1075350.1 SRPBCC family protein [Nocardia acididurans]
MRYRDCPTVEAAVKIHADAEAAWALLTDIELPARFSPELQRVEWVGDARKVAVGSRFRGVNRNQHLGEWETDCVVAEVEDGRRWTWNVVNGAEVSSTWGFEVEPASDGVLVRQWARMGPGPSGLSLAIAAMPDKEGRIVARRLAEFEAAMAANLDGIRQLLEAQS